MSKKRMITKSVIFLLILAFILKIFSSLSIAMGYNANPLYNYSSYSIFQEPDNSIDVLSIGDSNVYSSIFPLVWWEQQGFTGYTWGQPSQRIPETYEYLKKIYKHQKPSIVLIDGNSLFRDKTDIDNLDSITKAKLATIFPVISFHKNLNPRRLKNIFGNQHSVMKGYYYRKASHKVHKKKHRMKFTRKCWQINKLSASTFSKCIHYCKSQGSIPVLISVPNYNGWNYQKHNALQEIADKNGINFVDLNLELKKQINWKKDSVDGGDHLVGGLAGAILLLEDGGAGEVQRTEVGIIDILVGEDQILGPQLQGLGKLCAGVANLNGGLYFKLGHGIAPQLSWGDGWD